MQIDDSISQYPRLIRLPECPACGNYLFLYHPIRKRDPFIASKVIEGVLKESVGEAQEWIVACWTTDCDFFLSIAQDDLAECPECKKRFAETYSLYDHMRFQCTKKAAARETIKKAGAGEYLGEMQTV
ncbi:MAG: hypothetical protein KAJ51_14270 [Thermoplasmata archaeon]|nr:hypothetical protein [Thermoplasmata archaeon]